MSAVMHRRRMAETTHGVAIDVECWQLGSVANSLVSKICIKS